VSLEIAPGDRVAIVGRVGSGKTTIGKMITKLFVPDEGAIFIDGADIRQLDPAEIRENIGLVSQEPWLIAGSVEQNIILGAPNAGTDEMLWAADLAGVSDFVNRHPDGFKMMVAERGEGLSGGQRQAISIARALVRKPPVLLFDEPTSSMNARSERSLITRLKETKLDCTVIVITHRTSLLALVDRVIVVDDGKIVGAGSVDAFLNATLNQKGNANKSETADDSVKEESMDK